MAYTTLRSFIGADPGDRSKPWNMRHSNWVDWFNNRRLLEPIGNIPPAEAEERYYAMLDETRMAA